MVRGFLLKSVFLFCSMMVGQVPAMQFAYAGPPISDEVMASTVDKVKEALEANKILVPEDAVIQEVIRITSAHGAIEEQPLASVNLILAIHKNNVESQLVITEQMVRKKAAKFYGPLSFDPIDPTRIRTRINDAVLAIENKVKCSRADLELLGDLFLQKELDVGLDKTAKSLILMGDRKTIKSLLPEEFANALGYAKKTIDMYNYDNGDVDAFRAEIANALFKNPQTIFILRNLEMADRSVQAVLATMIHPGSFETAVAVGAKEPLIMKVKSVNAVFFLMVNANQDDLTPRKRIGFPLASNADDKISPLDLEKVLTNEGIPKVLLSAVGGVGVLKLPSSEEEKRYAAEEYKRSLSQEIQKRLEDEGIRHQVQFQAENQESLINSIMKTRKDDHSSLEDPVKILNETLSILIMKALTGPDFTLGGTVILDLAEEADCGTLLHGSHPSAPKRSGS